MISVIMPVYNAEKFLRESVDSILNQTEENLELIIVNDGSNDKSEEIINSYHDERIVYIKQENGGEASARNVGLNHAKGELVAWQDADDISLPNRLALLKSQFSSSNIGFVHSDMLLIDEMGNPIGYWQSQQIDKRNVLKFILEVGTPFNNPSIMARKAVLEKYKFDENLKIGEDTEFNTQFAIDSDSIHINKPLVLYRRHSNNLTNENDYNNLYLHMSKIIKKFPLEFLIPEINWDEGTKEENEAKANILLSLFFSRRGMFLHANDYILKTKEMEVGTECNNFIVGISNLILKNYQQAITYFNLIQNKDAVVENYLGESFAFLSQYETAKMHFLESLSLNPDYEAPMDNLKSIGSAKGLNFIDPGWRKYLNR